ncbi:hypothetical protein M758_4G086400 [Ceratodon purpureus]|uniref:Uncharacterized protein n=1 Tax=Ceratodon purpureus TaxID=3225 RepID=A0A8T0I8E5_CERPU|nr:hypothetical protein KC19_4G085700 [Ceratodon purpureus]KAG0618707.1 hypothetical protein M758_4G086400 [Ceratodon purpureus]
MVSGDRKTSYPQVQRSGADRGYRHSFRHSFPELRSFTASFTPSSPSSASSVSLSVSVLLLLLISSVVYFAENPRRWPHHNTLVTEIVTKSWHNDTANPTKQSYGLTNWCG